jgi:hypothetical protein
MSQLSAKFGNMAENQPTNWDRWVSPEQAFPKQVWGEWFAYFVTWGMVADVYYTPFFFAPLPSFSYHGSGNPRLLHLGCSRPSLFQVVWWLRLSCGFESSLLFTFELFGGKGTKLFELKLLKPVKKNF